MSFFVIFGNCALLGAQLMLLTKIWMKRDCTGISGKTQELYSLVFLTRNLDLFSSFNEVSISVFLLKIVLIVVSYSIVISIFFIHWRTYQNRHDTFRIELLIIPSLILSFLANYGFDFRDIFWAFSVYLECVVLVPQVHFTSRTKRVEKTVYEYVCLLTIYKSLYLADAIYAQFFLGEYCDRILLAAGTVQLIFCCDFLMTDVPRFSEDLVEYHDKEIGGGDKNAAFADKILHCSQKPGIGAAESTGIACGQNLKGVILTPAMLMNQEKVPTMEIVYM